MYGRHDLEGNGWGAGRGDRGRAPWLWASLRPALYGAAPGRAARGRWKWGDCRDGPGSAVGGRGPPPALGAEGPPGGLDGGVLPGGVPALVRRPGVRLETPRQDPGPRKLRRPRRGPHPRRSRGARRCLLRRRERQLVRPLRRADLHRPRGHRHRPHRPARQRLEKRRVLLGHGQEGELRQRPPRPALRGRRPEPVQGRQGPRGLEAAEESVLVRLRQAVDRHQALLGPLGHGRREVSAEADARPVRAVAVAEGGSAEGLRSTFTSTAGGVMTEEAGAVTGHLELLTRSADEGSVAVLVGYAGADEWYTVSGSPVTRPVGVNSYQAVHEALLVRLTTPGPYEGGNELPVDLLGR